MVLETTYTSKIQKELINDLVGKPIGVLQSFKMKGSDSKRMIIEDVSINTNDFVNSVSDATYANIELRPIGILIRINKGLRNFTWVIPYYHLVIYKTNGISIHAQGCYIRFKNNITFKENKKIFDRILNEKAKYDANYRFSTL